MTLTKELHDVLFETEAGSAVSLSENSVTIPSGGSSTATATIENGSLPRKSIYSGRLVADLTGEGENFHAIFGFKWLNRVEVRKVTKEGDPAPGDMVFILPENLERSPIMVAETDENGVANFETPDGDYSLFSWGFAENSGAPVFTIEEDLEVTSDVTVSLDEGATVPVDLDENKPGQVTASRITSIGYGGPEYPFGGSLLEYYPRSERVFISRTHAFDTAFSYGYYPLEDLEPNYPRLIGTSEWHKLLFEPENVLGPKSFEADYDNLVEKATAYKVGKTPKVGAEFVQQAIPRRLRAGWSVEWRMDLPQERTEYLSPEVLYYTSIEKFRDVPGVETPAWEFWKFGSWRPGAELRDEWGGHPLTPHLRPQLWYHYIEMYGRFFQDSGLHAFADPERETAGWVRVFRDNELVYFENRDFSFGLGLDEPAPSSYRVQMEGESGQLLSSRSLSEFEFDTGREDYRPPVVTMRVLNSDPRNVVRQVPARVEVSAEDEGEISSVSLTVSFDGGGSWEGVPLIPAGEGAWLAEVDPPESTHVSLRVDAADASGNETSQTITRGLYVVAGEVVRQDIELREGWNLISLPVVPENADVEKILDNLGNSSLSDVESVWHYRAETEEWINYRPDGPDYVNDLEKMEDGKSYWIDMRNPATLPVSGRRPSDVAPAPAYDLHGGWNMVGFTNVTTELRENYLGPVGEATEIMYGWDASTGSYEQIGSGDRLIPGRGYWIAVSEDSTLYP